MSQVQTAPLFSARLVPYRSLGRSGIWLVVALAATLALIPGTVFFLLGAWPVLGFLGLVFGYLKLDTATRGYYTGRLQIGALAAVLSLAAAGVLLARWIPWM